MQISAIVSDSKACSLYFIKIIESNGLPAGVKKVKNLVHVIFEHSHGVETRNNLRNFVMGYIEWKCHIAEELVSKIVILVSCDKMKSVRRLALNLFLIVINLLQFIMELGTFKIIRKHSFDLFLTHPSAL